MQEEIRKQPATVGEAVRLATSVLAERSRYAHETRAEDSSTPSTAEEAARWARNEADWLMQWAAGCDRTALLLSLQDEVRGDVWDKFWTAVARRVNGEPLQYIVGEAAFYGRTFHVEPGCLIPRPETELLAEAAITYIQEAFGGAVGGALGGASGEAFGGGVGGALGGASDEAFAGAFGDASDVALGQARRRHPKVVDIGTGSGVLAVTIALESPTADVLAVDVSADALGIARSNSESLGASVSFVEADAIQWLKEEGRPVNVIVSNPPYIPSADIADLDTDVREHEPRLALDGGDDGLDFYRRIAGLGQGVFEAGSAAIFLEVGMGQAPEVRDLFSAPDADFAGWTFELLKDLRGIERVVKGVRV